LVVALGTNVTVMLSALAGSLLFEQWTVPSFENLALLCASGLFLTIGHVCIFTAYRVAHTGAVAPFFYTFTVWALISGIVVFGVLPNALAIAGIVLIVASGVTVVLLDRRRRRLMVSA
jgi:drug/metabolite transporter (DMT)-like permease